MRLIIDSNILISAYTVRGRTYEYWTRLPGQHDLIISPEIFSETERTLRESEFELSDVAVEAILVDILKCCTNIRPKARYLGVIADEGDRHLVNLAQEIAADAILTGDRAIQAMGRVAGISIKSLSCFTRDMTELGDDTLDIAQLTDEPSRRSTA